MAKSNPAKIRKIASVRTFSLPGRIHIGAYADCDFYVYSNLGEIADIWMKLQQKAVCSPFQTYPWIKAVVEAQHPPCRQTHSSVRPVFVVGYAGNKPVAILPFAIRKGLLGDRLVWLGEKISDYNGMIVDRSYAAFMPKGLICRIVTMLHLSFPTIHAVHLIRNPIGKFDIEQAREPGSRTRAAEYGSHAVTLNRDWKSLYAKIRSSKSRQRLRAKYRSLQKTGQIEFRQIRNGLAKRQAIQQVLDWKSQQLASSGRRDPFGPSASPSSLRATVEATEAGDRDGMLKIFGLFRDGELVAGIMAFVSDDTFYYFVSAYDPQLGNKYSAGIQLLVKTLELASRAGFQQYDFLIGDESYKHDWCDTDIPLVNYTRPFSLRGKFICSMVNLRLHVKKLVMNNDRLSNIGRKVLMFRNAPKVSESENATHVAASGNSGNLPVVVPPPMTTEPGAMAVRLHEKESA